MTQALAELHLLLSRAFLPPMDPVFAAAFRRDLADDLDALAQELPFDCAHTVRDFRSSLDEVGSEGELLQGYSALFLQPPIRVYLNASVHLDGSLLGPSSKLMEEAYHRHGLSPSAELRDLSDHLSRLLEFVALLFARAAESGSAEEAAALSAEAREFSVAFLRSWLPGLAVEVRGACEELGLPRPYQHLAELAAIAVWEGDAWRRSDAAAQDRPERAPRQANCSACGQPYAEDAALMAVRRIMEKRGLDTTHLDRCPNCRGLTDSGSTDTLPARQLGIEDVR